MCDEWGSDVVWNVCDDFVIFKCRRVFQCVLVYDFDFFVFFFCECL